jgi:hypothetical protein
MELCHLLTDPADPFLLSTAQFKYLFAEIEIYRFLKKEEGESGERLAPTPRGDEFAADEEFPWFGPAPLQPIETGFDIAALEDEIKKKEVLTDPRKPPPGAPPGPAPLSPGLGTRQSDEESEGERPPGLSQGDILSRASTRFLNSLGERMYNLESKYAQDVRRLEQDNLALRGRLTALETQSMAFTKDARGFSRLLKHTLRNLLDLETRLTAQEGAAFGAMDIAGNDHDLESIRERLTHLELSITDPRGALESLKQAVNNLEDKVDMGGVEFEEWHFGSQSEFVQWVKRNYPAHDSLDYGMFMDAFSMLHGLNAGNVSQAEALKAEHDTKKVQYPSPLAARVSTAFRTNYPDVFGTGGDPSGKSFGSNMTTYEKWHDPAGRSGLVTLIRERVPMECLAISNSISQELKGTPALFELAKAMLAQSRSFVLDLTRFVDDFYAEMSPPAMTTVEAWALTKSLMVEIFSELRENRNTVEHSRVKEPILTIWGALKTHEVMKRYVDKDFRDDPALSGILVRHILKRKTDTDGLDAIRAKLTNLTSRLSAMEGTVRTNKKQDKTSGS